jgi:hypothetical protein
MPTVFHREPLALGTETAPISQPSKTGPARASRPLAVRSIFVPPDPYSGYTRHRECEPTESARASGREYSWMATGPGVNWGYRKDACGEHLATAEPAFPSF